jgi:hypothetical protein
MERDFLSEYERVVQGMIKYTRDWWPDLCDPQIFKDARRLLVEHTFHKAHQVAEDRGNLKDEIDQMRDELLALNRKFLDLSTRHK